MRIRSHLIKAVALSGLVAVGLLAVPAANAEILHSIRPAGATETDEILIELVVPFGHLNGCYFTTFEQSRAGREIMIDLTSDAEDGTCAQVVSDARVEVPIGRLAAGSYTVTVVHRYARGPRVIRQATFTLAVRPATPGLRLDMGGDLVFDTLAGRVYQVRSSSSLGSWTALGEPIVGDGESVRIPVAMEDGAKYFRVEVSPGPAPR